MTSPQLNKLSFLSLLTDSFAEKALDNAATASGVVQLTDYSTAAALYIANIIIDPTLPQLTDAQMK